jgi:hypothetical protein
MLPSANRLLAASLLALTAFASPCLAQLSSGPDAINPSAAPSNLNNPSSVNPSAAASDLRNPSAINPSAGSSDLRQFNVPGASRTPSAAQPRSNARIPQLRLKEVRRRKLRRPRRVTRPRPASRAAMARQRRSDSRGERIMGSVCRGC